MTPQQNVFIGKDAKLDEDVLLGYFADRSIQNRKVSIGDNARIRSGTIVYQGVKVGTHFETGHYVIIREENEIGDGVRIWSHSVVDYGCRIGHNVRIHNLVYVAQGTVIEDDVFLAPGVMIANDRYPVQTDPRAWEPVVIRKGAKVGINVTLMPGVEIGEGALVGGGSVVVKNVLPGTVVVGNPARVIKRTDETPAYGGEQ